MTSGGSNSDFNGPGMGGTNPGSFPIVLAAIPEEMLLAWIEGELSAADVSVLAEKHPQAVAYVGAMKRDRAMLASVAIERAPADLSDRVMATLERETLLGLSQGALVSDSLPISQVPKRKTAQQIWWQKATPKLAMAAGVALIASVGAVMVVRNGSGGGSGGPQGNGLVGPIASLDSDVNEVGANADVAGSSLADARSMKSRGSGEEAGAALASNDLATPGAAEPAVAGAASETGTVSVASAIDASRAAALAGEGRLVLRVRDVSKAAAAKLAAGQAGGRASHEWKMRGELPPMTLAMLVPPVQMIPGAVVPDLDTGIASAMRTGFGPQDPGPVSINPLLLATPMADLGPLEPMNRGGVVDVLADGGSIEAARAQLSKLLGCEVEFEESVCPIVIDEPAATPEAVLWWMQPPESWGARVRVPLVVELK